MHNKISEKLQDRMFVCRIATRYMLYFRKGYFCFSEKVFVRKSGCVCGRVHVKNILIGLIRLVSLHDLCVFTTCCLWDMVLFHGEP